MRTMLILPLLAVAGCVAPRFPETAVYPFGLAEVRADAEARLAAAGAGQDPERREAVDAILAQQCPDWNRARLAHPLDMLRGNPVPASQPALGCHNQAALDAMAARRTDLTAPPERMGPVSAEALNRGIEQYRTTGPAPLPARARTVAGF